VFILRYRSMVYVEALAENECTIHRAVTQKGERYWLLWFYVKRVDNDSLEDFAVPVIPNGVYTESGPGGRSWGLNKVMERDWQISPSIHISGSKEIDAKMPNSKTIWHATPLIVEVLPLIQPWMVG